MGESAARHGPSADEAHPSHRPLLRLVPKNQLQEDDPAIQSGIEEFEAPDLGNCEDFSSYTGFEPEFLAACSSKCPAQEPNGKPVAGTPGVEDITPLAPPEPLTPRTPPASSECAGESANEPAQSRFVTPTASDAVRTSQAKGSGTQPKTREPVARPRSPHDVRREYERRAESLWERARVPGQPLDLTPEGYGDAFSVKARLAAAIGPRHREKPQPMPAPDEPTATEAVNAEPAGESAGKFELWEGELPDSVDLLPDVSPGFIPTDDAMAQQQLLQSYSTSLELQIEELYECITGTMHSRMDLAQEALGLVSEAHDKLLIGTPADLKDAEVLLQRAKLLTNHVRYSQHWSNTWAWAILSYELVLLFTFIAAIVFDKTLATWLAARLGTELAAGQGMVALLPAWNTMLWGAIGGIMGGFYSLHWHVAEMQDFDKQHALWYVVNPFMGLVLGAIVYLVVGTVLSALLPGSMNSGGSAPIVALSWLPTLIAAMGGFRQRMVLEFIDEFLCAVGLSGQANEA